MFKFRGIRRNAGDIARGRKMRMRSDCGGMSSYIGLLLGRAHLSASQSFEHDNMEPVPVV